MKTAALSLALLAALVLAPMGCRERSTPPPPQLVGAPGPVDGEAAPEDQPGIGGSGVVEDSSSETSTVPTTEKEPRPESPFSTGETPPGPSRSTIP